MAEENKSTDILGIAPYGKALNTAVKRSFDGVEGFLKAVCMPALDELGLMMKDQVRYWRLCNILRIVEKAKGKLEVQGDNIQIQAHPRVALAIFEHGSVIDDEDVQELWAGLFAASCTLKEQNDDNLIFVNLLKQLTFAEAKILNYTCSNARKILHKNGLVTSEHLVCDFNEISKLTGITDIHNIDRQLDHLESLELINGGFNVHGGLLADIAPTALALNLFVRCQGFSKSTAEYWEAVLVTPEQRQKEAAEHRERIRAEQEAERLRKKNEN